MNVKFIVFHSILQEWDMNTIAKVLEAVSTLVDARGFKFVLLANDVHVIKAFDSVCAHHKLNPVQISDVAYVLGSSLPGFSVGVFLPKGSPLAAPRILARQLQALEPIHHGRIGVPSIDAYMDAFVAEGQSRSISGVQRPVELIRHVLRSVFDKLLIS
jgi:hypothetical protein